MRANYENHDSGVHETQRYLDLFSDNLLLGGRHELRNRRLHVDWVDDDPEATPELANQSTQQVTQQVGRLLVALGEEELSLRELMGRVGLKDRNTFVANYLNPAFEAGLIGCTIPDKPTSRLRRYRRLK